MDEVRNLLRVLDGIAEPWQPHRVASFDSYDLKAVRLHGEFVWHTHEVDELFLVLDGELTIRLRDRDVVLAAMDVFVVPRGVEHCPSAPEPVRAVLIEVQGTVNTGDAGGERTAELRELD
jgi:mannose-6-phosphate isomerase-like protein (cupin superfamily)